MHTDRLPEKNPLMETESHKYADMNGTTCAYVFFPKKETHKEKAATVPQAALSLIGSKLIPALCLC